jgi:hypothetical protein
MNKGRSSRVIFLVGLLVCTCHMLLAQAPGSSPAAPNSSDNATVTFRRVFKGSSPEFIEIAVRQDGSARADLRQLSEDAEPQTFQMTAPVRSKIFELADHLHNFEGIDLDVHRRIADLGEKTLRYEKGAIVHEVRFNYTINRDATQLVTIFEGISQEQQDLQNLEQKSKYDRLGVNDALRQFENDLSQKALPEPERLLPVLDRIAADARLVDVARQRARALAERIRLSQTP